MKRNLLFFILFVLSLNSSAQKGFGIDGSLGFGQNGGEMVNPILLEGRVQWNDYFSTNLGVGLWNSGYKDSWKIDQTESFTLYRLSDNKTLPSMQLSMRGQFPVFKFNEKTVRLFVEPKLYFLPFSARTVNLMEIYYEKKTDALTGAITYKETGDPLKTSLKSECHPRLYGGIQGGLSIELMENFDLALSYGYTNLDLFKDLRGQSINDFSLDNYLPGSDLHLINISLLVHFNLN